MDQEKIFQEALSNLPGDRLSYLESACAGNSQLRSAIEAMLAAHEASGNLTDQSPIGKIKVPDTDPSLLGLDFTGDYTPKPDPSSAGTINSSSPDGQVSLGQVIANRYRLLEVIGEGGMGSVYLADQSEPVKRQVAVKLIKRGMDSKTVLNRFEAERQALALMDHPHIARVYDGGTTPSGQPFFVMELVRGIPITRYCDEHRLGINARLELFVLVCQAVQHAHQKGIIHRDLKPANVLVMEIDGRPSPKVIDFGVAKAIEQKLTEATIADLGMIVGTPAYMSPEQADPTTIDIDTRSDIYALGVILYELFTGSPPFDSGQFKQAAILEMLRLVREEEPARPSTKISSMDSLPNVAANRGTEPVDLARVLRGELDCVVMKALEKDRTRRYESANGFARDIKRYLADEMVEARPPSAAYRLTKFVRRNKGRVISGVLLLLTLLGGLLGTGFGWLEAKRQEGYARKEAVEKDQAWKAEKEQRKLAEENEIKANKAAFAEKEARLKESVQRALAEKARARTREALDSMVSEVTGDSLATQKNISSEQKKFLRDVLNYYKEFAGEKADDELSRHLTAKAALNVGDIQYRLGQREESLDAMRKARNEYAWLATNYPQKSEYQKFLAKTQNNLGILLAGLGREEEALVAFLEACSAKKKLVDQFHGQPSYLLEHAAALNNLGIMLDDLGRPEEALLKTQEAHDIRQKVLEQNPGENATKRSLARTKGNLGNLLGHLGKVKEAESEFNKARDLLNELILRFPKDRVLQADIGANYCNLALLLMKEDKNALSLETFNLAIKTLNPIHDAEPGNGIVRKHLANSTWGRALILDRLKQFEAAVQDWDRFMELNTKDALKARPKMAISILKSGKLKEALVELNQIPKDAKLNSEQYYDIACFYSLATAKSPEKKQEYADLSMELLLKAEKEGMIKPSDLSKDPNLQPLRDRKDFQNLLADLEKKAKVQPDKKP